MTAAPLRLTDAAAPTALDDSAQHLFTVIADTEAVGFPTSGAVATAGEKAQHAIALAWPHARVVSFDIFDTLVVRKVASPRDVFLHLATAAPFSAWGIDAVALAQHRQEAENTSGAGRATAATCVGCAGDGGRRALAGACALRGTSERAYTLRSRSARREDGVVRE